MSRAQRIVAAPELLESRCVLTAGIPGLVMLPEVVETFAPPTSQVSYADPVLLVQDSTNVIDESLPPAESELLDLAVLAPFTQIVTPVTNLLDPVTNLLDPVTNSLSPVVTPVVDATSPLLTVVTTPVQQVLEPVTQQVVTPVVGLVGDALAPVTEHVLAPVLSVVDGVVTPLVEGVLSPVVSIVDQTLNPLVSNLLGPLVDDLIQPLADKLLVPTFAGLEDMVADMLGPVDSAVAEGEAPLPETMGWLPQPEPAVPLTLVDAQAGESTLDFASLTAGTAIVSSATEASEGTGIESATGDVGIDEIPTLETLIVGSADTAMRHLRDAHGGVDDVLLPPAEVGQGYEMGGTWATSSAAALGGGLLLAGRRRTRTREDERSREWSKPRKRATSGGYQAGEDDGDPQTGSERAGGYAPEDLADLALVEDFVPLESTVPASMPVALAIQVETHVDAPVPTTVSTSPELSNSSTWFAAGPAAVASLLTLLRKSTGLDPARSRDSGRSRRSRHSAGSPKMSD